MSKIIDAVEIIKQKVPELQAIYLFGSYGTPYEDARSDIDLAILSAKPLDSLPKWHLSQDIAHVMKRDVDIVDLKQASTVLRAEVIASGRRIFCKDDIEADLFETMVYSAYAHFNEDRKAILDDIKKHGGMDNVLLIKAESLERCIARIREEYVGFENELETNYTKQDAILLNLLRACETVLDMGSRAVRLKSLGLPQSSRDVFVLLEKAGTISSSLSRQMQNMVGFRNIAIHNYTKLDMNILKSILNNELDHLIDFSKTLISK